MSDIHFTVEKSSKRGYTACAVGHDIFTEAENLPDLRSQVRDAVHCHFDAGQKPVLIHLNIAGTEVLVAAS